MNGNQETLSGRSNDEPNSNSELTTMSVLPDGDVSRQPKNLQDLLQLSTSLQTEQSATQIDPARAQFLKGALASLNVDFVTELKERLEVLQQITAEPMTGSKELPSYEEVFEDIIDQVENIDIATTFYQIGGRDVMSRLLGHTEVGVRAMVANTVATCCRNNPFCQLQSTEESMFSNLINLAENELSINAKYHAISAISAIVRDNTLGIEFLKKYKGLVLLNKAMESGNEKVVIKVSYLISALCDTDSSVKDELISMGIVEKLISLVKLTSGLMVEHFLRALESVTRDHPPALRQCLNKQFAFYSSLDYLVTKSKQDDAYEDIGELATLLQNRLRKEAEAVSTEDSTNDQMYDLTMCKK